MREFSAPELIPVRVAGMPCRGGVGSVVGWLHRFCGGALVPLDLLDVCRFIVVPFWHGRQPDVWFWQIIAKVSFYRIFHLFMSSQLNITILLFLDLAARFLHHIFCFLYCRAWNGIFCHFGQREAKANVGLFQLLLTSLPCHSSRQVENLQEISCCFWQWDSAITSTIYASIVFFKVITAWFVHSWKWLSGNASAKILELTTSRCRILQTVQSNAIVDHGGCL